MKLSLYEQETIISYNEGDKAASVYTHNKALRRKLEKLALERPAECRLTATFCDGRAADYEVPKGWVKISPARVASEAQRSASKAALEKAFQQRSHPARGRSTQHLTRGKG